MTRFVPAVAIVTAAAFAASACASRTMKLPPGPGAPTSDGADVLTRALAACRGVRTLTAEVGVSGRVGTQKIRGRLTAGVAAPASARIEAVAPFGAPVFIFVATGRDATLLLPRDDRVLQHGRPDAVLEAVSGVPLGPADLRAVLTGCPMEEPSPSDARSAGANWRIIPAGIDTLFLTRDRDSPAWRLVAFEHLVQGGGQWRAEYRDFHSDLPRTIHLAAAGPTPARFDLQLALSQVDVNVTLGRDVFQIDVPARAVPITLDELRRSGPLADRKSDK